MRSSRVSKASYDVIVVGGGVAGLFTAYNVAKAGFSVAIVESKQSAEHVGEKVCGDAVGEHHFKNVDLEPPRLGVDALGVIEGVRVFSPSKRHFVTARGRGYALDRKAFGRRLMHLALSVGAELLVGHSALKPVVEGTWVKGVVAAGGGGVSELRGRVVVEATGAVAAIRTKLPNEWWISYKAPPEDFNVAYRVIAEVEEAQDTRFANIYLDVNAAPGGYWWWFPKGERVVNVGLGVKSGAGAPNPRELFEKHIAPRLSKAKVLHAGGGIAPTRRVAPCMVWNGLVAVGDAAYTANPIHGGGIGPALVSSYYAAHQVIEALEEGEASIERLWGYHHAYLKAYGIKQASLDVARVYLQSLSNEDLECIIESKIVSDEELSTLGYRGELAATVISKVASAVRLLRRPSLFAEIIRLKEYMDRAASYYSKFPPSPAGFEALYHEVEDFYAGVKERYWKRK